jgi:SM-20-related protein
MKQNKRPFHSALVFLLASTCRVSSFMTPTTTHINTFPRTHHLALGQPPPTHQNQPPTSSQLNASTQTTSTPKITQSDIDCLTNQGYLVIPNFLPRDLVEELRQDIGKLRDNGAFCQAKIGQDSTNELNKSIRIAETCFLGRNRPELINISGNDSVRDRSGGLYQILDVVCDSLVELCWKESEAKLDKSLTELLYAYYPTGGFYRRHRDAIPGSASVLRKYSLLLYLNRDDWSPEKDGGQLRIHLDGGGDEVLQGVEPNFVDVDPLGGTLVLFKSELIPHEVLDTNSERFAIGK